MLEYVNRRLVIFCANVSFYISQLYPVRDMQVRNEINFARKVGLKLNMTAIVF